MRAASLVPENIKNIIEKIVVNAGAVEEIDELEKYLKGDSISHEIFTQYLLDLGLNILSRQFQELLFGLELNHPIIYQALKTHADQNNQQSLFYMAHVCFKRSSDDRDLQGVAYLRQAAKRTEHQDPHYGAFCALAKIDNHENQTGPLLLENTQRLKEIVEIDTANVQLLKKILAVMEAIIAKDQSQHVVSQEQVPGAEVEDRALDEQVEVQEPPQELKNSAGEASQKKHKSSDGNSGPTRVSSRNHIWSNPYNPYFSSPVDKSKQDSSSSSEEGASLGLNSSLVK